jgi:hypothetical protein
MMQALDSEEPAGREIAPAGNGEALVGQRAPSPTASDEAEQQARARRATLQRIRDARRRERRRRRVFGVLPVECPAAFRHWLHRNDYLAWQEIDDRAALGRAIQTVIADLMSKGARHAAKP